MSKPKMRQRDDYNSSTRTCPCGSSITWEGIDDRLDEWMKVHGEHAADERTEGVEQFTSDDGMRAYGEVPPKPARPSREPSDKERAFLKRVASMPTFELAVENNDEGMAIAFRCILEGWVSAGKITKAGRHWVEN